MDILDEIEPIPPRPVAVGGRKPHKKTTTRRKPRPHYRHKKSNKKQQ